MLMVTTHIMRIIHMDMDMDMDTRTVMAMLAGDLRVTLRIRPVEQVVLLRGGAPRASLDGKLSLRD